MWLRTHVRGDRISVGSAPWYKERVVLKTTLGSLLTVVLLRTAHYNLAKLRVRCLLTPGAQTLHLDSSTL